MGEQPVPRLWAIFSEIALQISRDRVTIGLENYREYHYVRKQNIRQGEPSSEEQESSYAH
jgi:hypothetical protein